jgi:hypothetical protein
MELLVANTSDRLYTPVLMLYIEDDEKGDSRNQGDRRI